MGRATTAATETELTRAIVLCLPTAEALRGCSAVQIQVPFKLTNL